METRGAWEGAQCGDRRKRWVGEKRRKEGVGAREGGRKKQKSRRSRRTRKRRRRRTRGRRRRRRRGRRRRRRGKSSM
eukprot:762941-Hanusia_phi.AAC.3